MPDFPLGANAILYCLNRGPHYGRLKKLADAQRRLRYRRVSRTGTKLLLYGIRYHSQKYAEVIDGSAGVLFPVETSVIPGPKAIMGRLIRQQDAAIICR